MYVSRVTVDNFRNFKHLDVLLPSRAVIIGANRVGKSNFLFALQLAVDPNLSSNQRKNLTEDDFYSGNITADGIKISVEISAEDDDDWIGDFDDALIEENKARFTYWFVPKQSIDEIEQESSDDGENPLSVQQFHFLWYIGDDTRKTDKKYQLNSTLAQLISVQQLHALRDANDLLLTRSRSTVNITQMLDDLNIGADILAGIVNEIQAAGNRLSDEDDVKDLTNNLRNHTTSMVGLFEIDSTLNVVTGDEHQLMRAFRLFVDGRDIVRASLGEANILYFALLIEYLEREQEKSQSNYISIICLEEPEAHIHPHIQRAIFRYFLERTTPLIITSHSPHLASVSKLSSLVVFQDTDSGTRASTITPLVDAGNLSEAEVDDLERYLDVSRSEMLFSRGVILVEGIAELFIIPAVFKALFDLEPDKMGISVIAVHGTNFSPFAKVLSSKGFNMPFVIITDGDMLAFYDEDGNEREHGNDLPGEVRKTRLYELMDEIEALESTEFEVFVGEYTLEIDLILSGYVGEFIDTYGSLYIRPTRPTEAMNELINDTIKTKDIKAIQKILDRLEEKGKGRFAQILSPHLDKRCPPYIEDALNSIYTMVAEVESHDS